jgi:hypothetical protein
MHIRLKSSLGEQEVDHSPSLTPVSNIGGSEPVTVIVTAIEERQGDDPPVVVASPDVAHRR